LPEIGPEFIANLILWFVVFLFSLSFHESAHAWTSEKFGDPTGRYQGRITLNPLPHIDPIGTVLFPILGFLVPGALLFGWAKPVETNPLMWTNKTKANIMVSAAGPISNFILATIAFLILKGLLMGGVVVQASGITQFQIVQAVGQSTFMEPLAKVLSIMLLLNVSLGVFNLFPVPPLDGSHVLESLLPPAMADAYAQIRPFGFILLLGLVMTGVLGMVIVPTLNAVLNLLFRNSPF
jgi:Zn-dependent protease